MFLQSIITRLVVLFECFSRQKAKKGAEAEVVDRLLSQCEQLLGEV